MVTEDGNPPQQLGLASGAWFPPLEVRLERGRLLWTNGVPEEQEAVVPHAKLLEEFTRLVMAPADDIAEFALSWGPLGICKHNLPFTHRPATLPIHILDAMPGIEMQVSISGCRPREVAGDQSWGWEQIRDWRHFTREAAAILSIATELFNGKPGVEDDWNAVYERYAPDWEVHRLSVETQILKLTLIVNGWLEMGDVRPVMDIGLSRSHVHLAGNGGLFGALALQLAATLSRAEALAICVNCGNTYQPDRKPQKGRRTFCPDCRNGPAYSKHFMREKRKIR